MAAREERLTPATRNYVIFGLLFVVAVGLAVRDFVDPRERRGESDSALRVLIVSASEDAPITALVDVDGFNVSRVDPRDAIRFGRDLLDDDEAPGHRAAIAYADEYGYGFVALDLRSQPGSDDDGTVDWELSEAPPESARYAVFSVGDVAVDGPRMHSAGLPESATLEFAPRLAELDSIRLGLYDHPDLTRLWAVEPNAMELQARQVLDNRGLDDRREIITRDHARWAKVDGAWPSPSSLPGTVAGRWERVLAAPISGGLLLEVRKARARVSAFRKLELAVDEGGTLEFLPATALVDDELDESGSRQPCPGLPERVGGGGAVAPDGEAVVVRRQPTQAELFVFEHDPNQGCRARLVRDFPVEQRGVGRANAGGGMAWNYDADWLQWWDAAGAHRVWVAGVSTSSGPWWVDDRVLAMIAERSTGPNAGAEPTTSETDLAPFDFEPVLVLLGTTATDGDEDYPQIELGTRELFGELLADAPLVDLRPAGAELLLTTERCPDATIEDPRPCLHRIRFAEPVAGFVDELEAGDRPSAEALTVETLGPIPPHVELAVAPNGSRVAWIDRDEHQLWVADLRGPRRLVPRRVDGDTLEEQSLRISADGRVLLSEITVELPVDELGTVVVPRAFVLEPAPSDPVTPEQPAASPSEP